ncbi:MAG: sensor histidine kinase [Flavobacteriales bacterium]|nr:sensor histidine kinase [Flavobacteriales bacterium]
MRFILAFLFANLLTCASWASPDQVDSLKFVLKEQKNLEDKLLTIEQIINEYKGFDIDSALFYCDEYERYSKNAEDSELLAKSDYFYASVYSVDGDFEQMTSYAYPALDQFKSFNDHKGQIKVLLLLGRMHAAKKEFHKAYEVYSEALIIAKSDNDYASELMVTLGISNAKFLEENLEESEKYLFDCLQIIQNNALEDSAEFLAKIYTNLGNVNSAKTNDLEAIDYYKKSHSYYWKTNDKFGISLTAFNIGDVYNYNDMYDSSLKYFNITLQMGNELHNYEEMYYAYLGFTEAYERMGQYDKAFEYEKLKHAYSDSLQMQKYNKSVLELESQYNAEKKIAEIKSKEKEIEVNKIEKEQKQKIITVLAIGGGMLSILSIALLLLYRKGNKANQLIKDQRNSLDKTLKQKEILLQEVHHRVKNNLQLIASLLNLQLSNLENETAIKAIEESRSRVQAIALMHKGLYQDDNYNSVDLVSYVNELVDNLKTISRSAEREVLFKVDVESIKLSIDHSVPIGLILSELISNSLKHAFVQMTQGEIDIKIKSDAGKTILIYSDNGCGLPEKFNIEEQESLGFTVISALTDQIGGTLNFVSHKPFSLELRF